MAASGGQQWVEQAQLLKVEQVRLLSGEASTGNEPGSRCRVDDRHQPCIGQPKPIIRNHRS
jgi:hypothetical protein